MTLRKLGIAGALVSALVIAQLATSSSADAKARKKPTPRGQIPSAININGQGSSFVDTLLTNNSQNCALIGFPANCPVNFPTAAKNGWLNVYGLDVPAGYQNFAGNQFPGAAAPPAAAGAGPVNSGVVFQYGATGSGTGQTAFLNCLAQGSPATSAEVVPNPIAFAGTDNTYYSIIPNPTVPISCASSAKLVQIPSVIGAAGLIYNNADSSYLTAGRTNSLGETVAVAGAFTRKELCAIYRQTITNWSDFKTGSPSKTLRIRARSGGSGTTLILGRQLQANCGNGPWTSAGAFPNNVNNNATTGLGGWTWNSPALVDSSAVNNFGVSQAVKTTPDSIGVVDAALGKANANKVAKIQNQQLAFVAAGSAGALAAFKNVVDVDADPSRIELGIAGVPDATWDPTDIKAYPLSGATYFWFYGVNGGGNSYYDDPTFDQTGVGTRQAIKDFINWYTIKGGTALTDADKIISTVTGYGPVPGGVTSTGTCPASPTTKDIKCQIRKLVNNPTNGI